jgi:hypothetical protein
MSILKNKMLIMVLFVVIIIITIFFLSIIQAINPSNINIVGYVKYANGTIATGVNVTLWHDGEIVQIPNNPQYAQTSYRYYSNNSWFEFNNLPDGYYVATCMDKDYFTWGEYTPDNPLPLFMALENIPNVTGFCINQYLERPIKIYSNVSRSEIDAAISIANGNTSIRQITNGTNSEVVSITRIHDELMNNTIYGVLFIEQPTIIDHRGETKYSCLCAYVNAEQNSIIKIKIFDPTSTDGVHVGMRDL